MDDSNLQSGIEIIDKIKQFYNSSKELLLFCGFSLCGKSEILDSSLENLDEDTLVFRHLCFENTTIDDFLLNFYDSFRKFSLEKKVSLKKSLGEGFANKVSFYFKNIDKKCVIIVDNYELVSKNTEILNFLAHIASFENTKLILVSQNREINFFINQTLPYEVIEIKPHTKDIFSLKLNLEGYELSDNILNELYELTSGFELYLKMVLRYSKITNISMEDLIAEFKKRGMEFSDFLISKVVSLVPPIYFEFLKNLSGLNHAVSMDFIKNYNLGDVKQIEYLEQNLLISKFDNNVALRNYFKKHFISMLSVQEKYKIFSKLNDIYEQELAKSPRDRLLRLSRESIRKQIEAVQKNIPNIVSQQSIERQNFSYISLAQESSKPWFDKKEMDKRQRYLDKKRELEGLDTKFTPKKRESMSEEDAQMLKAYRKQKLEREQKKESPVKNRDEGLLRILNEVSEHEKNYRFREAIEILLPLRSKAQEENTKLEILEHLAYNSEKLNNFEDALEYYAQMGSLHLIKKDYKKYYGTILDMAKLYKDLYRFKNAKEEYFKIINSDKELDNSLKSSAYLGLGDIFESENRLDEALNYYKLAQEYLDNDNIQSASEIAYKTAILYDDIQDFDHAIEYYLKNIGISGNSDENKWLSQSYINLGLIYSYQNDSEQAIKYINLALETDEKNNNLSGVYLAARELSKIYETQNIELAIEYLREALECAKTMHDTFKEAFAYLELGDLYYNFNQDEMALESFYEAKKALGENILDENKQMIEQRINDMKIKMLPAVFKRIEANYA